MATFKSIAELSSESGVSQMRVRKLLEGVTPEVKVGRSVGYHPDALRAALINKLGDELEYLGVRGYAANILEGYTSQD